MIASITGRLHSLIDLKANLEVGPIVLDVLVSAADEETLSSAVGQVVTFHVRMDLEGDPKRGSLEPRIIGFLSPRDKRFFELFTTVNGIGPKKALKAMAVPIADIARAIKLGNARFLSDLPQIGKQRAGEIVAKLKDKVDAFTDGLGEHVKALPSRSSAEDAAIAILMSPQIGLRRIEAEDLLELVKQKQPELNTRDQFVDAALPHLRASKG